jgi:hypothetical protein
VLDAKTSIVGDPLERPCDFQDRDFFIVPDVVGLAVAS